MLRNDLLDENYHFEIVEPKKIIINLIWFVFAALFIVPALLLYFAIFTEAIESLNLPLPYIEFNIMILNFIFIAAPVIYFLLKEILTYILGSDKSGATEMKLYTNVEMPINAYRDAFKTWQIIIIYLIPMIFMYPLICIVSIISGGNINLLILAVVMSFFMSFDLTLVIYVLFLKIRYNAEYIAMNKHVYSLSLYSKESIKRKVYSDIIKEKLHKFKKSIKIPKHFTKIICAVIIIAGLLFVLLNNFILNKEIFYNPDPEDFENYLEYCDAMNPAIKKYGGDTYSNYDNDNFIPDYTGCEILAGRNIIYCNDDDSVIYYDKIKDSVIRLTDGGKTERLCIYEYCRNNPDEYCGHMPNFVADGCYSDGVLYGVRQYWSTYKNTMKILKSYIIRYDIVSNELDKLIEFEMGDDDVFIRNMMVYGENLYAWVSAGYDEYLQKEAESASDMMDLSVVKIDLRGGNGRIIYSEESRNKEQILNLTRFYEGYFYGSIPAETIVVTPTMVPVGGVIYKCDADMKSFNAVLDLGYITRIDAVTGLTVEYVSINALELDIYNEYIYYIDNMGNGLCRYNTKMQKKEEGLCNNLSEFYIDGDMMYYTVFGGREIYRVKLDGEYTDYENQVTYVDFANPTVVYRLEPGDFFGEWSVKDDCVYAVLYVKNNIKTLARIKINSNAGPYIFWQ
ncbi:MAG: DUF5050 domain-containing protein [Oscillospiraceae bacterium]|nr:DUF5050 domain-containing protein [Oscillospiraceae bacterium]